MAIRDVNTLIEIDKPNGDVERQFPITKQENILGLKDRHEKYDAALKLLAANSYIVDDVTNETYKIGSSNGKFYFTKSDVSLKTILSTIIDAAQDITKPDIGSGEEGNTEESGDTLPESETEE